jgi:hypothetical protein
MTEVYSSDVLERWKSLVDAAESKCAPGSIERRRVGFIRSHFLSPLLERSRKYVEDHSVARELARRAKHPEEVNLVENGDLSLTNRFGN